MIPRRYLFIGLGAILLILASLTVWSEHKQNTGTQAEHNAAIHQGEANAHVSQAQAIPDHAAELQHAKDDVARARAEVARVKRILAAQQGHAVPDPAGSGPALPPVVGPDPRDEVITAQGVLIEKQDAQIQGLQVALVDERKRSDQWMQAFESERKRAQAQEAATKAWKSAVVASRWQGRLEGFAAGAALGYLGGKL